jgi:hypothetical protein
LPDNNIRYPRPEFQELGNENNGISLQAPSQSPCHLSIFMAQMEIWYCIG